MDIIEKIGIGLLAVAAIFGSSEAYNTINRSNLYHEGASLLGVIERNIANDRANKSTFEPHTCKKSYVKSMRQVLEIWRDAQNYTVFHALLSPSEPKPTQIQMVNLNHQIEGCIGNNYPPQNLTDVLKEK